MRSVRASARKKINDRVLELLELVGSAQEQSDLLSASVQRRSAPAHLDRPRAGPDPKIVVLDEPTSALDVSVRAQILTLLKSLQQRLGVTFLVISHDFVTVSYLSSTVAVMHRGRIVEIGPTGAVYDSPRHPYTQRLVASIPTEEGDFLSTPRHHRPVPRANYPRRPAAMRCGVNCARSWTTLRDVSSEDPALVAVGQNHRAACHFTSESAEATSGGNS